mmetsp:Transcript_43933/g.50642  ORF Transcript_43933/g.50642 Transcript_43933/m.50642 type:complete len:142 (+) Transcript_43933:2-427(+)
MNQQQQHHLLSLHHYYNNKVSNASNSVSGLMAANNASPAANATSTPTTQPKVATPSTSTSTSTGRVPRGGGVLDGFHHRADDSVVLPFATHRPVSIITPAVAAAVSSTAATQATTTTTTTPVLASNVILFLYPCNKHVFRS